jgi:hypothetical protein
MIVDDPVDAAETLNTDLAKIQDWSMKWLVKFLAASVCTFSNLFVR